LTEQVRLTRFSDYTSASRRVIGAQGRRPRGGAFDYTPAKVFVDSRGRTLLQTLSRCTKLCGKNSEDDDVQFCTIGGAAGRFFLH